MDNDLGQCKAKFVNFEKSIKNLDKAVKKESLNQLEKAGLIQFFEVGFGLGWQVIRDYLISEGYDVKSPKESIQVAFSYGLIESSTIWLEALEKRNLALCTYDDKILNELESLIVNSYFPMMNDLKDKLKKKI